MKILLLIGILCLSSCSWNKEQPKEEDAKDKSALINLVESTHIIRTLIQKNTLSNVLEDHDPEQLSVLLDNFSPAQMAFEIEVLATTVPLVVVYFFKANDAEKSFLNKLEQLADRYDDTLVKFVVVDADQLFSLVENLYIDKVPAVLIVKKREIVDHSVDPITIDTIQEKIDDFLNKPVAEL